MVWCVAAGGAMVAFTLFTVPSTWGWSVIARGAAMGGAGLSALYPALRAARVDVVEALVFD